MYKLPSDSAKDVLSYSQYHVVTAANMYKLSSGSATKMYEVSYSQYYVVTAKMY